ncbi:uncharacterized protein LOC141607791 [Silene latifolia]|uniref:uncharacterized protein LOC141607791 n=1 Tax=Silene latifolia TaxID=37657 RepID=UPI003D77AD81
MDEQDSSAESILKDCTKGAFIQGRSIIENVLICEDIVHMYARSHVSPRCLFKIDLQKAYDTVEWDFVEQILSERWPFHYHPLCKNLKLTHLMFADDLLMFCKGDAPSILLLMKAFTSFSNASGLKMNNTKSEMFFSGIRPELKADILRVTGFQEGTMPFRYLGVPIQPGKLSKKDCNCLTEKIISRTRGLGAKKLSYAGRITLINSVLNTLHSYLATMF